MLLSQARPGTGLIRDSPAGRTFLVSESFAAQADFSPSARPASSNPGWIGASDGRPMTGPSRDAPQPASPASIDPSYRVSRRSTPWTPLPGQRQVSVQDLPAGSFPGRPPGPLSRIIGQARVSRNDFQAEATRDSISTLGRSKQQAGLPLTSTTCASTSYPAPEDKSKEQDDEGQDAGSVAAVCACRVHSIDKTPVVISSIVYLA